MVIFNNGRNKIIPFSMKIKWSVLIIFASLFIISIAYFFITSSRQSTINKCLRLMIHESIIPSTILIFSSTVTISTTCRPSTRMNHL